jgi:hypothetical protein
MPEPGVVKDVVVVLEQELVGGAEFEEPPGSVF